MHAKAATATIPYCSAMNIRSRLAWVRPFLMLVLVVTVPVVLYWFGYVSRSVEAAVRQYNVTVVAVATSLEERLGTLDKVAGEAERRAAVGQSGSGNQKKDTEKYLRSLITGSGSAGVTGTRHLQVTADHRSVLLSVGPKDQQYTASVSVKLENLVPWDIVEAEFDGLFVLSDTGRLLAQDRRLPSQARGLPIRISRDERRVDLAPLFELDANRDPGQDQPAQQDAQVPAKPPAAPASSSWRSPTDFSRFETITVAGQRYVAFLQPVRVYTERVGSSDKSPGSTDRETLDLLVAGLVSEDHMRGQARSLSRQTLARVFALVTFGVLLIPLLKLRFIGTYERMRYRDVWVMTLALLGITAVVVLLVLDGPATSTVRQVLDGGLKELHEQIKDRANAEARAAVRQLRDAANLRGFREALDQRFPPERGVGQPRAGACPDAASSPEPGKESAGNLLVGSQGIDYPVAETIFVATRCGAQTYKWDARTLPTGLTSVGDRGYFRDALALPPAGSEEPSLGRPDDTAREFVVSKTSGQEQMVFALPVGRVGDEIRMGPEVPPELRTHVAALATPMRSVQRTVVPSPFEYVLVGRDARVKFRNAKGPYLDERFFEQVRGGSVMAPLAADDPARTVEGEFNYRWRQFHMRASDVPELNMTLVTFYDTETARHLAARAFAVAAGVAVLAILSALAGSLLAAFFWGRQSHDWLWPDTEDTARYLVGIAVCGVAIVLIVWVRDLLEAEWFALAVAALPGVVMMLCGSPLWFRTRLIWTLGDAQSSPTLYKAAFCGFALSMLLALVAVPTVLAFDDALRLYVAAYERVAAEQWSRDRYKRARDFEDEFALVDPTGDADGCTAPNRTCASREHYARLVGMLIDPSDAFVPTRDAEPEANPNPLRDINLYRGCPGLEPGHLGAGPETASKPDCRKALVPDAPLPWSFTAFLARPLALFDEAGLAYLMALSPSEGAVLGTAAARPMSGWTWRASVLVWIVAGFALLAILIYTVAVHVLGLGWQNWRPLDAARSVSASDGARWLMLRPTRASIGHLVGPTTQVVDLRRPATVALLAPPAAGHTLVVQHVDAALADDARHEAVLTLATGHVAGCLVLCSEIDPLYYVSQRIREAVDLEPGWVTAPADGKVSLRKRIDTQRAKRTAWAEALQDFHNVQAPPPELPELGSRVPENLRRLLLSECAFSDPLIEIAERLSQAPDLASHSENEVVGFILDAARPYYRSLWDLCTEGERLLLIQLAEESVVNPKRFDLLRQLHHRGLVLVEPRFQLMNRSFGEFVKSVQSRERVIELEYTPAALGWKRFSTPLYTFAAVVIAILLYTQQDLVAQMLGIATGAAGALNSLRHLGLLASNASGGTEKKSANA